MCKFNFWHCCWSSKQRLHRCWTKAAINHTVVKLEVYCYDALSLVLKQVMVLVLQVFECMLVYWFLFCAQCGAKVLTTGPHMSIRTTQQWWLKLIHECQVWQPKFKNCVSHYTNLLLLAYGMQIIMVFCKFEVTKLATRVGTQGTPRDIMWS